MTTEQIIGIISIVVVTISVKYFWQYTKNKVKKEIDTNVIKQPSTYLFVGILMIVGFTVILGVLLIATDAFHGSDTVAAIIFFSKISMFSFLILLFALNWKLELYDSYCTHTNLFGKKKEYLYQDLKVVDVSSGFRIYHNKRKVFDISIFQDNWKAFPNEYKKHNKIIIK